MPVSAKTLIEDRSVPLCIKLTDSVQKSLEIMVEKDFSQLPIVDDENKPVGLITADSILRGITNLGVGVGSLQVRDVAEKHQEYSHEVDIFDILDTLNNSPAVLITDNQGKLQGIVTNWDTADYFRKRSEDMMLVEDIESALKEHIKAAFTDLTTGKLNEPALQVDVDLVWNAQILSNAREGINRYLTLLPERVKLDGATTEKVCNEMMKRDKELKDLTLNQFTELLARRWDTYGNNFSLGVDALKNMLKKVADARNTLAHFRDELSPSQRDALRFCARWFENNQPIFPQNQLVDEAPTEQIGTPNSSEITDIAPVAEELAPDEGRYAKLAIYLQNRDVNVDELTLSLSEIEEIIGGELPPSAHQHRSWWANDSVSHIQSKQWLEVGWRVASINLSAGRITFVRTSERVDRYLKFFSGLLAKLRQKADFPIRDISPRGTSWHVIGAFKNDQGVTIAALSFSFARRNRFRVELYIDGGDEQWNKEIYDMLFQNRYDIEHGLGQKISTTSEGHDVYVGDVSWERLDSRRASRLAIYHEGSIEQSPEQLQELQQWAVDTMVGFQHKMNDFMVTEGFEYRA